MSLELNYLYEDKAHQFNFFRFPKTLFTDQHYQGISVEAKVLYSLLLDRISLSIRNGWTDDKRRIYIYFTQEEVMAALGCGKDKATKLFRELDQSGIGLIERCKQGQGRPTRIYVKNFILPLDTEQSEPDQAPPAKPQTTGKGQSRPQAEPAVQSAEKTESTSEKSSGQDCAFPAPIKTDKNQTDLTNTESSSTPLPPPPPRRRQKPAWTGRLKAFRSVIREKVSYDILLLDYGCDPELLDSCIEWMAEACAGTRDTVRINQEDMPIELVRSRFLKLDMTHIAYVLDYLSHNTTPVGNIRGYTLSVLYNAPTTMGPFYAAQANYDIMLRREMGA